MCLLERVLCDVSSCRAGTHHVFGPGLYTLVSGEIEHEGTLLCNSRCVQVYKKRSKGDRVQKKKATPLIHDP